MIIRVEATTATMITAIAAPEAHTITAAAGAMAGTATKEAGEAVIPAQETGAAEDTDDPFTKDPAWPGFFMDSVNNFSDIR